jgi:hypothetical protein
MRLMLQQGSEESARHQAIKLMGCLIMNIAMAYAALDALYVELKVAGGFFRGRKMFAEVDQQMRYELVGYITALTAVLVRETLREPDEVDSIVAALETLVFLPEWQAARPAYHRYVARYRDSTAGGFHRGPSSESIVAPVSSGVDRYLEDLAGIIIGGWLSPTAWWGLECSA